VQKSGGVKALTKPVHDDLKCSLPLDDAKVEVTPQIINNTMVIGAPHVINKTNGKVKARMVKPKVTAKKSRLERVTSHLYDLENSCGPEKALNVDLGLYQMEDY
jgi:hypothetical protein